ncbi:MAG: hypothetical protein ABIP78_01230 [Pyrinomonadaceae bacterium]
MIDTIAINEIIKTYQKHGWVLRRVLLSPATKISWCKTGYELFDNVPAIDSDIDAAWFSRPPKSGGVAWEIRHLGTLPFALLEKVDEDDAEFEAVLNGVETRLSKAIAAKESA